MYIIFEGLDNSGKSTQIKRLITYFAKKMIPFHVMHYSAISKITPKESKQFSKILYKDLMEMLLLSSKNYILDRSWIGENVYAPMYRNTPGDWIFDIEIFFKQCYPTRWKEIYLFTFIDSVDNLIAREDGKSFSIDTDKKNEEIERFVQTTHSSYINNKIIIDIKGKNENEVHEEVISFLKTEEFHVI